MASQRKRGPVAFRPRLSAGLALSALFSKCSRGLARSPVMGPTNAYDFSLFGKNLKTWAVPSSWEIQATAKTVRFRPPVRPNITIARDLAIIETGHVVF